MKGQTLPKSGEGVHTKKARSSSSKSAMRNRMKKFEGIYTKDKIGLHTNIPQSVTLMRSRSYEKNLKMEGSFKKSSEADEKNKSVRSKSASEKHKMIFKYRDREKDKNKDKEPPPPPGVLEKVALFSRNSTTATTKNKQKDDTSSNHSAEDKNKLKEFTQLLPLCEKELKRIEDAWLRTVYCSLLTRANLFKFLSESFPNVEKSQFFTEDKKLLQRFEQVKNSTKTESDNLMNLVKSLLTAREKTKDEYQNLLKIDKELRKTITQQGEDNEQLKQTKMTFESPKMKDASETTEIDLHQKPDNWNKKKDLSFMSFFSFGNQQNVHSLITNQLESSSKSSKAEELGDYKVEAAKLTSLQKDYETLKAKYSSENESYEKKIKDLEILLEEKVRILKQEKEVKTQLQTCLSQFQAQQKRLSKTFGYEQLEYLLGSSSNGRDKRREELWLAAIKLILKGFFLQLKNLEMEKNKMLCQLQTNDMENFNVLAASIIQKENFAKSIKQQMKSFNKVYQRKKNRENSS